MKTLITHPCYSEAMNFISLRLSCFPRIYYPWFCEVITETFGIDQPAHLFSELIEKGMIGSHNQMIFIKDEGLLRSYCEKALAADLA